MSSQPKGDAEYPIDTIPRYAHVQLNDVLIAARPDAERFVSIMFNMTMNTPSRLLALAEGSCTKTTILPCEINRICSHCQPEATLDDSKT
jgi:hypothetical protein